MNRLFSQLSSPIIENCRQSVSRASPECLQSVARVSPECLQSVSRASPERLQRRTHETKPLTTFFEVIAWLHTTRYRPRQSTQESVGELLIDGLTKVSRSTVYWFACDALRSKIDDASRKVVSMTLLLHAIGIEKIKRENTNDCRKSLQ